MAGRDGRHPAARPGSQARDVGTVASSSRRPPQSEEIAATQQRSTMNAHDIRCWLTDYIGDLLNMPTEQVDPRVPFADYGISSRDAVTISGELEELLGRRLLPTLAYEHPSIDALSRYLAD